MVSNAYSAFINHIQTSPKRYHTVVIDPPWKVQSGFTKEKFVRYGRALPYETMKDEDILYFPIDDFADQECDLFMWVVHGKLHVALDILQKWGFKYHALLTWDKQGGVAMMGFYRRTEIVIYAYRGKFGVNVDEGHYIPTLFSEKSKRHSEKPNIFYELIRKRTREPRIDIFARKKHFGFDAWGNEVDNSQARLLEASTP